MTSEDDVKKGGASWVKWVLMGCGVLVLGGVGFFACVFTFVAGATEEPRLVAEEFLAHTTSGELEAARRLKLWHLRPQPHGLPTEQHEGHAQIRTLGEALSPRSLLWLAHIVH